MKKRISVIITLIIMLLLAFSTSAAAYMTGDVDGNGKHTAADARLVLRYSAKLEKLNDEQLSVADVDYNGKVSASDARYILRVSAKLDKPFGEIDTEKFKNVLFDGLQSRKKLLELREISEVLTRKISEAVFDEFQFNRYLVSEKATDENGNAIYRYRSNTDDSDIIERTEQVF